MGNSPEIVNFETWAWTWKVNPGLDSWLIFLTESNTWLYIRWWLYVTLHLK